MAEYDNTNSGAVFKPFETMKMILQGKVNIEGNDRKVVLIADKTKSDILYQKRFGDIIPLNTMRRFKNQILISL